MNPNVSWEWPQRVDRWTWKHLCDHGCRWQNHRGHPRHERNDVKRCRHGRLYIVTKAEFHSDSNGGWQGVTWRRLRPYRLAFWRARKLLDGDQ